MGEDFSAEIYRHKLSAALLCGLGKYVGQVSTVKYHAKKYCIIVRLPERADQQHLCKIQNVGRLFRRH